MPMKQLEQMLCAPRRTYGYPELLQMHMELFHCFINVVANPEYRIYVVHCTPVHKWRKSGGVPHITKNLPSTRKKAFAATFVSELIYGFTPTVSPLQVNATAATAAEQFSMKYVPTGAVTLAATAAGSNFEPFCSYRVTELCDLHLQHTSIELNYGSTGIQRWGNSSIGLV